MASVNRTRVAAARRRQEEDLALLRSNEESAPHIRKFLRWVRNQNRIEREEIGQVGFPLIVINPEPTDQAIEGLIVSFIELNGEA